MGLSDALLSMWVIYDHPSDMPEHVVARRHEVHATGPTPTDDLILGPNLRAVRAQLPQGLDCLPRAEDTDDESHIIEVWL